MTHRRGSAVLVALAATFLCRGAALAADAATACKTSKMIAAGNYDLCLLRTTARAMRAGVAPDLSKCDAKFTERWAKAEAKGGAACPTTGDAAALGSQVSDDVAAVIAALTPPPPTTTTATTTTTSVTATTGTTLITCGTYPGCGGSCPAGLSCWANVLLTPGPTTVCTCLPAVATPCGSTGGGIGLGPLCGGACPAGEVCSTIDLEESLNFTCGCMPSGQPACLTFAFGGPCTGGCPTDTSCAADPVGLLGCKCQ